MQRTSLARLRHPRAVPNLREDGETATGDAPRSVMGIDMAALLAMEPPLDRGARTEMVANDKPTQASGLDLRIWVRLLDCAKIIEKRLRRNFEEQFGTTLPRFDILASLDRAADGLRMGELSRALLVSNGNVTAVVRQLQDSGLVSVQPDPEDRRSAIVALTPAGREQFRILAQAHHGWVREALADFPEDRQRALLELLTQLKSSII